MNGNGPSNPYPYGVPPMQGQSPYAQPQPYAPAPYVQPPHPGYGAPHAAPHAQPFGYVQPQAYAHGAAGMCEACGVLGQTKHVNLIYNIGALVIRFHKTMSGQLCKRCISDYFWKYSLITMFLGWWGVISFVVSLVTLPVNAFYFLSSLGMSQPSDAEYAHAPGHAQRGIPGWKLAAIVFGAAFGLFALLIVIGLLAG
jgi:hypothetical protein